MQLEMAQGVLEETEDRGGGIACSGCEEAECLCPIVNAIGSNVLFVDPDPEKMFCTRRLSFGHGHICTCTARKERFRKQGGI